MNYEPFVGAANRHLLVAGADSICALDFAADAAESDRADDVAHASPSDSTSSRGGTARQASGGRARLHMLPSSEPRRSEQSARRANRIRPFVELIPGHQFMRLLDHEKWRADRSGAPLSLVLFRFSGRKRDESTSIGALSEFLLEHKRQTDVVGDLAPNFVAIVLPDTNEEGTDRFVQKVARRAADLGVSIARATYPDDLFDTLACAGDEDHVRVDCYPLFVDASTAARGVAFVVKRAIDIAGATFGIITLAPVMIATAIVVAATSPGPVIFRQIRLGRSGVPFMFYKFRSMVCDADDRIHREYVSSLIDAGRPGNQQRAKVALWTKLESDPRVTRVGRFLRRTSIDELPQLFNVLKGDMSLVGPRPALPYEALKYQAWHLRRLMDVKPGITGLWQVDSRGQSTFEDMVRMDLRYLRNWSLAMDLRILVKTLWTVLRRRGPVDPGRAAAVTGAEASETSVDRRGG